MDLDWEVIHNEGRSKGVGPEIETFLGPSNVPRKWISPHPNPYAQPQGGEKGKRVHCRVAYTGTPPYPLSSHPSMNQQTEKPPKNH